MHDKSPPDSGLSPFGGVSTPSILMILGVIMSCTSAGYSATWNLRGLVESTRTGAVGDVIVSDGRPVDEIIQSSSQTADLVFMGMANPRPDFAEDYERLKQRARTLHTTVLVLTAGDLSFGEVLPELSVDQARPVDS